jgi:peroxiredoxin
MMRLIATFILLSSISILVCSQDSTVVQGNRIPVVTIQDIDGHSFNTIQISNDDKPFIIVFWTTCCKTPIQELSALNDVYEEWKQKTGVRIYAVSVDDSRASMRVKPFTDGRSWEFDVLLDPNQTLKRSMNVNNLPHTFVLNGQGEIVGQKLLYVEGDEDDIFKMILQALPNH